MKKHTINEGSWHYRLVMYSFLGELPVKRACPYWAIVVPSSFLLGALQFALVALYRTFVYLAYYPVIALFWVLGFRPRYWRGWTASIESGEEKLLIRNREVPNRKPRYRQGYEAWRWWMPFLVVLPLALVLAANFSWVGYGSGELELYASLRWYLWVPVAYAMLITLILLGNGWKHGPSRLIKWAYFAVCPELEIVESAPSPAEPANG